MFKTYRFTTGRPCISFALFAILLLFISKSGNSQSREYYNPYQDKPFYISLGIGFGLSNNPLYSETENKTPTGMTFSGALGYRISSRFSLEFGPAMWVEGADIFQNKVPSESRVSNKRTMVTLTGTYQLSKKTPLSVKLGGGIGTMVYSPKKTTIAIDGNGVNETEYFSGAVITSSLIYRMKISEKIYMHPSLNFYYCDINNQKIEYASYVNDNRPSFTSDIRIQFLINF